MRVAKTSGTAELEHARAFVNERRKELKLRATGKLSKGYVGIPTLNTIAQSLRKVGVVWAWYFEDHVILAGRNKHGKLVQRSWHDPQMVKFMQDFDEGLYPELVLTPKPIKGIDAKEA